MICSPLRSFTVAVLGAILAATIAACSSAPAPAGTSAAPAAPPPTTAAPLAQVGQILTNRGVQLTVKSVRAADSIEMNMSNMRQGSGFEKFTTRKPDTGGKFVIVETHIANQGGRSMDLTCGLPVTTAVADTADRNFDAIRELDRYRGNPECNKMLQPGFESDMTYVFMVPASASIVRFGFYDSTDPGAAQDWSRFTIAA